MAKTIKRLVIPPMPEENHPIFKARIAEMQKEFPNAEIRNRLAVKTYKNGVTSVSRSWFLKGKGVLPDNRSAFLAYTLGDLVGGKFKPNFRSNLLKPKGGVTQVEDDPVVSKFIPPLPAHWATHEQLKQWGSLDVIYPA